MESALLVSIRISCCARMPLGGGVPAFQEMQVAMNPDVSLGLEVRYRWHHHVDYSPYRRNALKLRDGVAVSDGIDEYGMAIKDVSQDAS